MCPSMDFARFGRQFSSSRRRGFVLHKHIASTKKKIRPIFAWNNFWLCVHRWILQDLEKPILKGCVAPALDEEDFAQTHCFDKKKIRPIFNPSVDWNIRAWSYIFSTKHTIFYCSNYHVHKWFLNVFVRKNIISERHLNVMCFYIPNLTQ